MPPHVFAYGGSQAVPIRINARSLPIVAGVGSTDDRYHLIDDDDTAAEIQEYDRNRDGPPLFRHLSPEELEDALDNAGEAAEAIEAGNWDKFLDMLLVAEREVYSNRITVIEAIEARNRVVIEQRSQTGGDVDRIAPVDIVTTG